MDNSRDPRIHIGQYLKNKREKIGWSVAYVAKQMRTNPEWWHKLERGHAVIDEKTFEDLVHTIPDVTLHELRLCINVDLTPVEESVASSIDRRPSLSITSDINVANIESATISPLMPGYLTLLSYLDSLLMRYPQIAGTRLDLHITVLCGIFRETPFPQPAPSQVSVRLHVEACFFRFIDETKTFDLPSGFDIFNKIEMFSRLYREYYSAQHQQHRQSHLFEQEQKGTGQ